jgi:hypothetical protein
MRFFLGLIFGTLLTIGGAYLYDHVSIDTETTSIDRPTPGVERPMVNWDVVDKNWSRLTSRARQEWNKLAAN